MAVAVISAALFGSGVASAQNAPVENVSAKRHPNLAAAQREIEQAFNSISAAQRANEFDMEGHAAKAKGLLDEANRELKESAAMANKNKR